MSNIIDSIQLSGTVYTIQGTGGGGNSTVELTQAEYDALVTAGTVSADTYYIITDAQAGDLTQYWTSAQTQSAITEATSGKVNTSSVVSSVTSASTDSEIPTAKAVFDAIPTGGSITIDPTLDSGSTNAVANSAITEAIANATDGRLKEDLVFSGRCGYGTIHSDVGSVGDEYLIINTYPSTKISFYAFRSFNENYRYEIVIQDIATKDTYRAYYNYTYNTITSSGGTGINYATVSYVDYVQTFTANDGYRIIGLVRDMAGGSRERYSYMCTYNANIPSGTTLSELFGYIAKVNVNLKGLTNKFGYSLNTQIYTDEYGGELYYQQTVFPTNDSFTGHTASTVMHTTQAEKDSWNGKLDASAITTSITSVSTDSQVPSAKAVFDAIPTGGTGGGKAIEAGRGISITTGETADTVSLNEAISASTASSSTYIAIGSGAKAIAGYNSYLSNSGGIAIGSGATANRRDICIGNGAKSYNTVHSGLICIGLSSVSKQGGISIGNYSQAYGETGFDQFGGISIGFNSNTQSRNAIAIGYNTVASGTTKTNINNQLTIDSSNQVYIYNKDNTEMICLQDHLGGGGATYSAGTNISISSDTVSCTLPIKIKGGDNTIFDIFSGTILNNSSSSSTKTIISGEGNELFGIAKNSVCFGQSNNLRTRNSYANNYGQFVLGRFNTTYEGDTFTAGMFNNTRNMFETSFGQYNNSVSGSTTFGNSGNTLFSVGNGTSSSSRHNAFEIRQNGDIYCSDGTNDVKLQDTITATAANTTALGGLSLVKLTQTEYDALSTKDSNTLYVIIN